MKKRMSTKQELARITKLVRRALTLLDDLENQSIYASAWAHGVKLSDEYTKKAKPVFSELKKIVGYKNG